MSQIDSVIQGRYGLHTQKSMPRKTDRARLKRSALAISLAVACKRTPISYLIN